MKQKIKIGYIGYGLRGVGILESFLKMDDVDIVVVCDRFPDRLEAMAKRAEEAKGVAPIATTDYKEVINNDEIDAIINAAAWTDHSYIAIEAMEAGKDVAFEVGGAYSINECWEIVKTQEKTGRRLMMLENVCYMKTEMSIMNMARLGIFGTIMHCDGGYCHDGRVSFVRRHENNHHYRLRNYMYRNCDNYPTHQLGPILKILNINRGNKLLYVSSVASNSAGLHEHILKEYGSDHPLADFHFAQGDIITTTIKCVNGETITLRLDTTLPRAYSRKFEVHGTKGMFAEDGYTVYLEDEHVEFREKPRDLYNNAESYVDKYSRPIWRSEEETKNVGGMINSGHGGSDAKVCRAFIESIKFDLDTPIDVYDTVTMMCISALSEESVAKGGAPVMVPDFTKGGYLTRKPLSYDDFKWNI